MLKRLGPLPRFVLGMAGILLLLAVTAALWWWLPAGPHSTIAADPVVQPVGSYVGQTLTISPDGRCLAVRNESRLQVWDVTSGEFRAGIPVRALFNVHLDDVEPRTFFSPDGRMLAFEDHEGPKKVKVWEWAERQAPRTMRELDDYTDLFFTADGKTLLTSFGPWNTKTGDKEGAVPWVPDFWISLRQLTDGRIVTVRSSHDSLPTLWDFTVNQGRPQMLQSGGRIPGSSRRSDDLAPDGRRLAAVYRETDGRACQHVLKLWDLPATEPPTKVSGPADCNSRPDHLQWSPDGRLLLVRVDHDDGQRLNSHMEFWNLTTTPPVRLATWPQCTVVFSPDGQWFLANVATSPNPWRLFEARTLQPQDCGFPGEDYFDQGLIFALDTRTLAAHYTGTRPNWLDRLLNRPVEQGIVWGVKIWDVASGRLLADIPERQFFTYFPDGKSMAISGSDGRVEIWDIPPRRPWWIDYSLPIVFILLLLLGMRLIWRAFRRPAPTKATGRPSEVHMGHATGE